VNLHSFVKLQYLTGRLLVCSKQQTPVNKEKLLGPNVRTKNGSTQSWPVTWGSGISTYFTMQPQNLQ